MLQYVTPETLTASVGTAPHLIFELVGLQIVM